MVQPVLSAKVLALLAGRVRAFGPNGELSAIDKYPLSYPVVLTATGITGDQQGDMRHHGGVEKAVHHYPYEHYAMWKSGLPRLDAGRFQTGGFGENISTTGLMEEDVCIGDIFRLGSALLQVSQARQPCWKLNVRFGYSKMSRQVQESCRTGWYYRVLQAGEVPDGAPLLLLERPCAVWPLRRLLHYFYEDRLNGAALEAIAGLDVLASSWRKVAEQRLITGQVEDWSRRLDTPEALRQ